jgi:RES domain-containing protein
LPKVIRPALLKKIKAKPLRARAYRIIARRYQHTPLSQEGSLSYGGRYNPPNQFGALYCGLSEEICWMEIEKRLEGPLKRSRFRLVPIYLYLQKVLDLTDSRIRTQLNIKLDSLIHPTDYRVTQEIARVAREAGFEGIHAPSSAGSGSILAIFLDRLLPQSKVIVKRSRKSH